jgi:hypothetical protein
MAFVNGVIIVNSPLDPNARGDSRMDLRHTRLDKDTPRQQCDSE